MAIPENVLRWRELVDANKGPYSTALLLAMMYRLSQGKADASNEYGARGLFLIHPNTAAAFDAEEEDLLIPEISVQLAVSLLKDRWDKISAAMAQHGIWDVTEQQLLQLTLPAYWWGPVPTLNSIAAGHGPTPAEVWSAIDRGAEYREFSDSILASAAEFQTDLAPAANGNGNGNGIGPAKPVPASRGLWVVLGLAAIGGLAWWDMQRGKKKKGKKKKGKKKK